MAKNSRTNKTAIGIAAMIIAAILIFAYVGISIWRAAWNPAKWIGNAGATNTQPNETDNNNSGVIIGDGESNGLKLTRARIAPEAYAENGVSTTALDAYVLTAEFENPNTTYKEIAFKTYYVDGTTEGIEERIDVVQSDTASMSATVSVKQSFNKQIIVEAYSKMYPETRITATFDYVCDTFYMLLGGSRSGKASNIDTDLSLFHSNDNENIFAGGTLTPDEQNCLTIYLRFGGLIDIAEMDARGYNLPDYVSRTFSLNGESLVIEENNTFTLRSILMQFYNENDGKSKEEFWQDLSQSILGYDTPEDWEGCQLFNYSIQVNRIYQGVDYGHVYEIDSFKWNLGIELADWSVFETKSNLQWSGSDSYIF